MKKINKYEINIESSKTKLYIRYASIWYYRKNLHLNSLNFALYKYFKKYKSFILFGNYD